MTKNNWIVEPVNKSAYQISFAAVKAGFEQYVLLTSDRHHDNAYADWKLEKRHLDMALERNAPIVDIGDLFCAMQGRNDKRRSRAELRHEFAEADNYFDLLLDEAEEFYAPYAHLFTVLAHGNHETAVRRHSGIDLTYNIARRMRDAGGEWWPRAGGYGGYIKFKFDGGRTMSKFLRYYHGSGGSAPVTKGVIQTNRRAVMYPDANIIATGHIHEAWVMPIMQERITSYVNQFNAVQWHVQCPTYKDEFKHRGEFHIERGGGPKPLGCVWLKFSYTDKKIGIVAELDIQ
jgi:hypothetical protein